MKKILFYILSVILILISGCSEKPPVMADGNSKMIIRAFLNSSGDAKAPNYVPMPNAKVILSSEYGLMVKSTDENGVLELEGLPCASYNVSVRMRNPSNKSVFYVGTRLAIETSPEKTSVDTVYAKAVFNSGIVINELYVGGPEKSRFYFYDQFIELYNSSDSIKYLDGMMVMRFSGNTGKGQMGPGVDEGNDGDIEGVTYAFKFPGKYGEKNYPLLPLKFLVLAPKAIDHRMFYSSSPDLSNADWEFYNQYSTEDMDNPNVPNLLNMRPDQTADFTMSLTNDIIIIASGKDDNWQDGIDISTILDGVEYKNSFSRRKTLDARVDNSSFIAPPMYQGYSMQRREAGVDTNEGSLDWETITHPTPGYQ